MAGPASVIDDQVHSEVLCVKKGSGASVVDKSTSYNLLSLAAINLPFTKPIISGSKLLANEPSLAQLPESISAFLILFAPVQHT